MQVQAKFRVMSVMRHYQGQTDVRLTPVWHGNEPDHPNRKFWEATPSGELVMTITNLAAAAFFEPGNVYSLTFEAEAEAT